MYRHVFGALEGEVAGMLVGRLDGCGLPDVRAAIPAERARCRRGDVTLTHYAWEGIFGALDTSYAGQAIVGWYHSHPGLGVFLSERDCFIHRHFFPLPGHVAYVVDPVAGLEGLFGWRSGELSLIAAGRVAHGHYT